MCCAVKPFYGLHGDAATSPSQGDETMGCGHVVLHVVVLALLCVCVCARACVCEREGGMEGIG